MTDLHDLPEDTQILDLLRKRIGACQAEIEKRQDERDRMQIRDTELRLEQEDYRRMVKEATNIIKVMTPPKTADQMRVEIEEAVYEVLAAEAQKPDEDGEMAVSRIMLALPPEITVDYANRGLENRIRGAVTALRDRGLIVSRQVDTQGGRKALLWSVVTAGRV